MDQLQDPERRSALIESRFANALRERERPEPVRKASPAERAVAPAEFIPAPPAWGEHVVLEMPLDAVFQHLYKNELFRLLVGRQEHTR